MLSQCILPKRPRAAGAGLDGSTVNVFVAGETNMQKISSSFPRLVNTEPGCKMGSKLGAS